MAETGRRTWREALGWRWALGLVLLGASCVAGQAPPLLGHDFRLFEDGPAWKLAQAARKEDTRAIQRLAAANPSWVRAQEPRFGQTVLLVATTRKLSRAVQALLEAGADPNQQNTYNGTSPLMEAAEDETSSALLRLMLRHGGNPNAVSQPTQPGRVGLMPVTPLVIAAKNRLESVQLLVEAGADVNFSSGPPAYQSPLKAALNAERFDVLRYLIVDKQARVHVPLGLTLKGDTIRIANLLRNAAYPLASPEYQQKMQLVDYLKGRGIDYRKAPIPKHYYRIYPPEFLDKY
jgi:hypothetical protein